MARVLELETPGWDAFVTRFQQTTPPVMAKGVEDTAFYRYARLLALNDVGGDPSRFSLQRRRLPRRQPRARGRFPRNLLVTQTHDTKRSGDVRARIGALAGMADELAAHTRTWLNACRSLTSGGAPTPVEQHFIFQTLLGVWPISEERLEQYLRRRCARPSSTRPGSRSNEAHEAAVQSLRARAAHPPRLPARLPAVPARASPRRATAPRSASCCSS